MFRRSNCNSDVVGKFIFGKELDDKTGFRKMLFQRIDVFMRKFHENKVCIGTVRYASFDCAEESMVSCMFSRCYCGERLIIFSVAQGCKGKLLRQQIVAQIPGAIGNKLLVALADKGIADSNTCKRIEFRKGPQHYKMGKPKRKLGHDMGWSIGEAKIGFVNDEHCIGAYIQEQSHIIYR